MRKTIIAGNWKMNKTVSETKQFFNELLPIIKEMNANVIIATPFTSLVTASEITKNTIVKIAAQNMGNRLNGAYTGEISPLMLKDINIDYVIIGHSERREYYGDTDFHINEKVKLALQTGVSPILCIGEKLEEREENKTKDVVKTQILEGLKDVSKEDIKNVIIAYEPVWAIGTGKTATPEMAQDVHRYIRDLIEEKYGKEIADEISILYGGSMKPENVVELLNESDIDGGLIGGASLEAKSFAKLIEAGAK